MDTERLLEIGERGIHLLFERDAIAEAFRQDADELREEISERYDEVHGAIERLVAMEDVSEGRRFIDGLSPAVRHVLVLLYFELLDGRLRRHPVLP